jgi:hypothetical protein
MLRQDVIVQESEVGWTELGAQAVLPAARSQQGGRVSASALDSQVGSCAIKVARLQCFAV